MTAGLEERLVALDVDDEAARQAPRRLRRCDRCPLAWSGSVMQRDAAERIDGVGDALVVGGDDHGVDTSAPRRRGDTRARSSDGRRYRRELFRGDGWTDIGRG